MTAPPERLTRSCAAALTSGARVLVPPAPARLRAAVHTAARAVPDASLFLDAPDPAERERRLTGAVDRIHAAAGPRIAAHLAGTLARWGALAARGDLLHGTGSWALRGILSDGALRPGGDGMTGEVATTGIPEDAVYLIAPNTPLALHAALTFAHGNTGFAAATRDPGPARAGLPPVAQVFSAAFFGPELADAWRTVQRLRTAGMEACRLAALERAVAQARDGTLPADAVRAQRTLGAPDLALATANLLAAVGSRAARDPALAALPPDRRLAAELIAQAAALRGALLCPVPGDPARVLARKARTLAALARQFPCVLQLRSDGISARPAPDYPWTGERLSIDPVPVTALAALWVPGRARARARAWLRRHDLAAVPVRDLDRLEDLRFVMEQPSG